MTDKTTTAPIAESATASPDTTTTTASPDSTNATMSHPLIRPWSKSDKIKFEEYLAGYDPYRLPVNNKNSRRVTAYYFVESLKRKQTMTRKKTKIRKQRHNTNASSKTKPHATQVKLVSHNQSTMKQKTTQEVSVCCSCLSVNQHSTTGQCTITFSFCVFHVISFLFFLATNNSSRYVRTSLDKKFRKT